MRSIRSYMQAHERRRAAPAVLAGRAEAGIAGLQYGSVAHIYRDHPRADAFQDDEGRYRQWLNDTSGPAAAAECTPPMDVVETSRGVELVLDLPGVAESSLTIVFSRGTLVVAGRK